MKPSTKTYLFLKLPVAYALIWAATALVNLPHPSFRSLLGCLLYVFAGAALSSSREKGEA